MLSKQNRLKGTANFKAIFKDGEKSFSSFFVLYKSPLVQARPSQIGLIASKKVGGAVQRNKARRLLSEAIRKMLLIKDDNRDRVYIIKKEILNTTFQELCNEVERSWT
jgi:ribonuclease P protein component